MVVINRDDEALTIYVNGMLRHNINANSITLIEGYYKKPIFLVIMDQDDELRTMVLVEYYEHNLKKEIA